MKNKIGVIAIIGALVLLIGGAALLYNKLSGGIETEQLSVVTTAKTTTTTAPEITSDTAEEITAATSAAETTSAETNEYMAPDFTVYDLDGNPVKLSDFRGKPVILNFWASWCGPCKMEMPDFDTVYKELGEEIQFLMVNTTDGSRETVETASEFIKESGYSFPVFYDTDTEASMTYYVYSIPATYFIDAEGTLIASGRGALDMETLYKGIDMIYEGRTTE